MQPLTISPAPGYTPEVGRLVSMLNYARYTTVRAVTGLTAGQLDHRHDDRSNTIGALLAHIAAVEWVYQLAAFEERRPTAEELPKWKAALDLGPLAWEMIRGYPLEHYFTQMNAVRQRTLDCFRRVDDAWLDQAEVVEDGRSLNHYWQWFHVCEDELNHRGQIRWLRSRLPA